MTLKATKGNVLIKIDLTQKERYRFSNGQEIYISRGHEYNLRIDNPNVAEVIDAENIPTGSLVLIHHNSIQDSYKVFEEKNIYSIPNDMVFLYNFNDKWIPNEGFVISERIFKPYNGFLIGIEPELVKNRMYIRKGIHSGKAVITLKNCDYEIIYFIDGKQNHIIRTREREIIGEDLELTQKIKNGEYLTGITSKTATAWQATQQNQNQEIL